MQPLLRVGDLQTAPEQITKLLNLRSGRVATFRLLQQQDAGPLGQYFLDLSDETRRRFGPHPLDMETAKHLCATLNPAEVLRLIATVEATAGPQVVAYFILQLGVTRDEQDRYRRIGIPLDPLTDCTLAPSVGDAYQNTGLGSLMMAPLTDIAWRLGRKRIVLLGGTQASNRRAVHFYEKHGFRTVSTFEYPPGQFNHDMVLSAP